MTLETERNGFESFCVVVTDGECNALFSLSSNCSSYTASTMFARSADFIRNTDDK